MAGTPKLGTGCISRYPKRKIMPKGYPSLTPEQKREIIARIKEKGERVADLAQEYGVSPRIIYGYLSRSSQNSGTLLELSKLKREKDALLKIVGQLVVDQKLGKKIRHHYGN